PRPAGRVAPPPPLRPPRPIPLAQRRRAGAERSVAEPLDRPEAEPLVPKSSGEPDRPEMRQEALARHQGDSQREPAGGPGDLVCADLAFANDVMDARDSEAQSPVRDL